MWSDETYLQIRLGERVCIWLFDKFIHVYSHDSIRNATVDYCSINCYSAFDSWLLDAKAQIHPHTALPLHYNISQMDLCNQLGNLMFIPVNKYSDVYGSMWYEVRKVPP